MNPKLFVILALLVLLPLGALGWLGWRTAWQAQEVVESRFRETLMDRLRDVHAVAARVVEAQETDLLRV